MSPCLLFFSSSPLSFLCTSVHSRFPLCVCVCVTVLFTFRNRELRWRSAGGSSAMEFQGIFSLSSHSTRKFTSAKTSPASVSLSAALGLSFGFSMAFNDGYIFFYTLIILARKRLVIMFYYIIFLGYFLSYIYIYIW